MPTTMTVQFGMRIIPPSRETKSPYTEIGEVDIPLDFKNTLENEDIALGLEAAAAAIRASVKE